MELNFPNAVIRTTDLFNREVEIAGIKRALQSAARRPLAIIGWRLIGKTSLLNIVSEWLNQEQRATAIHIPHGYTLETFITEIVAGIATNLGIPLSQTGLINGSSQMHLAAVNRFINVIDQLSQKQPRNYFVLCLDEFDSMLKKCDSLEANQILDFVLHVTEKTDLPLRFLFTMTQVTEQILHSYANSFLNIANLIRLSPWTFEKSCRFVQWLLKDKFTVGEKCQMQIFSAAGGHPYFTKAIFQAFFDEHRYMPKDFSITPEAINSAIEAAVKLPEVDFTLSNIRKAHCQPYNTDTP